LTGLTDLIDLTDLIKKDLVFAVRDTMIGMANAVVNTEETGAKEDVAGKIENILHHLIIW